jgi:hypothetical protein
MAKVGQKILWIDAPVAMREAAGRTLPVNAVKIVEFQPKASA